MIISLRKRDIFLTKKRVNLSRITAMPLRDICQSQTLEINKLVVKKWYIYKGRLLPSLLGLTPLTRSEGWKADQTPAFEYPAINMLPIDRRTSALS